MLASPPSVSITFPSMLEANSVIPAFQMLMCPIREDKYPLILAVTHLHCTGRLQTVKDADNSRYYPLIPYFYAPTGVPIPLTAPHNQKLPFFPTS